MGIQYEKWKIFVQELFVESCKNIYDLFTLSKTENNFCNETDEMAKSRQCDWLLLAISSVSLQKSFSVSLSVRTALKSQMLLMLKFSVISVILSPLQAPEHNYHTSTS